MSHRKKDGRGGSSSSGRPSASSLTDAVVAALAQVEATTAAESKPPSSAPPARAAAKPDSGFVGAGAETTAVHGGVGTREDAGDPILTVTAETVAVVPAVVVAADSSASASTPPKASDDITAEHPVPVVDAAAAVNTEPPPASRSAHASVAEAGNEETTARRAAVPAVDVGAGIHIEYFGRTDVGLVREHNEDNFLVVELTKQQRGVDTAILTTKVGESGAVFAVCDGMGGAAAGEVASQMAVDTVHEMLQNAGPPRDRDHFARRLVRAVEEAGSRIFSSAKLDRSRRGMGTTATVAGLVDHMLFVGQVGDSRAYVLRGDQFALITKDQSLVNQLIEAGQLTEEEAEAFEHSNIILQALGTTEEVTVDLTFLELRRGDRLLMCSDGLSGLVHAEMMKEVLKGSRDLIDAANQLIAMANAGGGHDNITVVLAEFNGTDLKEPSPDARVAYQQYPLPPEDPKDPDPSPRAVTIKSGGPKPGHDVKHEPARRGDSVRPAAMGSPVAGDASPGGRWFLVGVLLLVLLLLGVAIMLFLDDGARTEAPQPSSTTMLALSDAPSVSDPGRRTL